MQSMHRFRVNERSIKISTSPGLDSKHNTKSIIRHESKEETLEYPGEASAS